MVDIHCHILPGLDDGSDNFEESLRMARLAVNGGTTAVVTTPHSNIPGSYQNYFGKEYAEKFKEFNLRLKAENIPLKIYPGNEIFADENVVELVKNKKLLTLNNSDYLLVEFDFVEHSASVYDKLETYIAEGFIPVVAHPERYAFVIEDDFAPYRLKEMGCLLQVNKGSLKGSFGRGAYYVSHEILRRELADVVASDAHSPYMRTPYLADAYEMISEIYSEDYAELLLTENPENILNNKKIHTF